MGDFLGRTLSHRSSREHSKKAIVGQGRSSKHWLGTDGFLQLLVSSFLLYQTLACTKILVFSLNAYVFFATRRPWFAKHQHVPKTFGFLLFFCRKVDPPVYLYISGLIAPISLDFCASLGQSATMSGLLLASPVLGTTVGAVCGKFLASESNWNQDSHMGLRLKNREGKVSMPWWIFVRFFCSLEQTKLSYFFDTHWGFAGFSIGSSLIHQERHHFLASTAGVFFVGSCLPGLCSKGHLLVPSVGISGSCLSSGSLCIQPLQWKGGFLAGGRFNSDP